MNEEKMSEKNHRLTLLRFECVVDRSWALSLSRSLSLCYWPLLTHLCLAVVVVVVVCSVHFPTLTFCLTLSRRLSSSFSFLNKKEKKKKSFVFQVNFNSLK